MGIGAAFAAGLVKGFTQNIEREQTRRTAERDRLKERFQRCSRDGSKRFRKPRQPEAYRHLRHTRRGRCYGHDVHAGASRLRR